MKLDVTLPAGWKAATMPDGRRRAHAALPTGEIVADVFPLVALPESFADLVQSFVRSEPPPGTKINVTQTQDLTTRLGYPLGVVEAGAADDEGRVVEVRWCAIYQFLEYGGLVMLRAASTDALHAVRAPILEMLLDGRPDFSGPIAALEELFAGFDPPSA